MSKFEDLMNVVKNVDSEGPEARTGLEGPHDALPRDVDIDHWDLQKQEADRRQEFLDASWEEILKDLNGPEGKIFNEKLEKILDVAINLPLERKFTSGGISDLLYTIRNLMSEDASISGLGEIRIAYHTFLQNQAESLGSDEKYQIDSAFDLFQECYENYILTGNFCENEGDPSVPQFVQDFIDSDGVVNPTKQKNTLFITAIFSAIRALRLVNVQPECLFDKEYGRTITNGQTDLSGVSDEQILQKIQRAPMLNRNGWDRVLGMDQGHDVLGISVSGEQRPTLLPTFSDVLVAVEKSGRLSDKARGAKSLVELMRLSRGKLFFSNTNRGDRYWRYAYRTSDAADAPWEEEIIGWHDGNEDDE